MFVLHSLVLLLFLHGQTFAVKDLYILGLFPMEGEWYGGIQAQPTAEVALDYINNDSNMLPGYRLKVIWNNTEVSYASSSPAMTDMNRYAYFFRLVNSEIYRNYPRVGLIQQFNWTKVTTIYETKQIFGMLMEHIETVLYKSNIEVIGKHPFRESPKEAVQRLKAMDARIIIGAFYEKKGRQVFCEAFKIRFSGPKIVWVLVDVFKDSWWKVNDTDCTYNEILSVVGNYFTVSDFYTAFDTETEKDDNGITLQQLLIDFYKKTGNKTPPDPEWTQATYDAVWVIAHALNATMADLQNTRFRLEDFSYTNSYMGELIKNNTSKVNFNSISGHVFFDKNGDIQRRTKIQQFQDNKLVRIAWYDKHKTGYKFIWNNSAPILWLKGTVPRDSFKTDFVPIALTEGLYAIMCVLSALGMLLALSFLVFNIKFRNRRIIKMSSPNLNNITLLGCILAYTYVFVKGMDIRSLPMLCQIKGFFLVIAFSLMFGALLAKTWRVYIIFTKAYYLRKRAPKDFQLFIHIGAITGINVTIMVLWAILSPRYPKEKKLYHSKVLDPDNDREVVDIVWYCVSDYDEHFSFLVFGFQTTILLFGVFLAFTTRKVSIPILNDSKAIGLCIYNVIVLSIVGVPISLVLNEKCSLEYGLISTFIILGTTVTQCLIFVPKVRVKMCCIFLYISLNSLLYSTQVLKGCLLSHRRPCFR
ncbi:gamma-aminobutyric acid type B receptor subunit 1-like isoform X2 [Gigantopelta aegis]|uniref:gamma-aminobutyric acid type B receptor subunit 1-like isoform X2 n=1 Tax=Gigantopelta aegis TaxID=1735272 RepID=UPI001B888B4D|nr:gamma-aminobutyric acid type B receptor subunit 1-like isoform X2 [Gigantopelta aegis]